MKLLLLQMGNKLFDKEKVIGIEEVCRLTGYAKNTVYQYVNKNKIPYYKPEHGGRKLFFLRAEIENWLKGRKPETAEDYCQRKELELINSMKGGIVELWKIS